MQPHEFAVYATVAISLVLLVRDIMRWKRESGQARREDFEDHTLAASKAQAIAMNSVLKILAASQIENDSLRTQLTQVQAVNAALRERLEKPHEP
jgi:hypothetical protein